MSGTSFLGAKPINEQVKIVQAVLEMADIEAHVKEGRIYLPSLGGASLSVNLFSFNIEEDKYLKRFVLQAIEDGLIGSRAISA